MAITIINGKVWDGNRHILEGETMIGLSDKDESYLVSIGVAKYEKAQVIIPNVQQPPKQAEGSKISNINAKEAIAFVESISDVEELKALLLEETEGKKRATVIQAINERMDELEDSDDEDTDNEVPGAPLSLNLNPEEMIVS